MLVYFGLLAFIISVSSASVVLFNRQTFKNPAMIGIARIQFSAAVLSWLFFHALSNGIGQCYVAGASSAVRSKEVPTEPAWYLRTIRFYLMNDGLNGSVVFDKMSLKYRPNLLPAVENISLNITGAKCGCNRTNRCWQKYINGGIVSC